MQRSLTLQSKKDWATHTQSAMRVCKVTCSRLIRANIWSCRRALAKCASAVAYTVCASGSGSARFTDTVRISDEVVHQRFPRVKEEGPGRVEDRLSWGVGTDHPWGVGTDHQFISSSVQEPHHWPPIVGAPLPTGVVPTWPGRGREELLPAMVCAASAGCLRAWAYRTQRSDVEAYMAYRHFFSAFRSRWRGHRMQAGAPFWGGR